MCNDSHYIPVYLLCAGHRGHSGELSTHGPCSPGALRSAGMLDIHQMTATTMATELQKRTTDFLERSGFLKKGRENYKPNCKIISTVYFTPSFAIHVNISHLIFILFSISKNVLSTASNLFL